MKEMRAALAAEFIGIFLLVLAGTGAIVVDNLTGALGHVGVALSWGLAVMILIYALGHVSAHFNPAVTLALAFVKAFPAERVIPYLITQLAGATTASLILKLTLGGLTSLPPEAARKAAVLGSTLPGSLPGGAAVTANQALAVEFWLTFILIWAIMGGAVDRRSPQGFAGLAVGGSVALDALWGGPLTGASMNPARSFGPAIISGTWEYHWVYWAGPILGALAASWVYRLTVGPQDSG